MKKCPVHNANTKQKCNSHRTRLNRQNQSTELFSAAGQINVIWICASHDNPTKMNQLEKFYVYDCDAKQTECNTKTDSSTVRHVTSTSPLQVFRTGGSRSRASWILTQMMMMRMMRMTVDWLHHRLLVLVQWSLCQHDTRSPTLPCHKRQKL